MTSVTTCPKSTQYLTILRQHVLGPITTASTITAQERTEIADEQNAFEEFKTQVEQIPALSRKRPVGPSATAIDELPTNRAETLCTAYKDTVMDVSHFDDVYGKSLGENLVAEFGPELASLFQSSSGVSFTAYHKDVLLAAIEQRVQDREACQTQLDAEKEALTTLRRDLTSILDELDTSILPSWYQPQFNEQVEKLVSTRQEMLASRSPRSRFDGHALCEYLYATESWTYPVLTAVGRLLTAIDVQDEDG